MYESTTLAFFFFFIFVLWLFPSFFAFFLLPALTINLSLSASFTPAFRSFDTVTISKKIDSDTEFQFYRNAFFFFFFFFGFSFYFISFFCFFCLIFCLFIYLFYRITGEGTGTRRHLYLKLSV